MSNEFIIRQMTTEDIESVADIELECFSLPWSVEALSESMSKDYAYFTIVECEEGVVAYGSVYVVLDEAEIINVAVKQAYRNKGLGKMIVKELLRRSEEANVNRTMLEVRESNVGAIALYEKCGFENIGIRKNFYEKPQENAVIMRKEKK